MTNKEFDKLLDKVKSASAEATKMLEKLDRFKRSRTSFENTANWLLALSGGTFLWFLGSFEKFKVFDEIYLKGFFIISSILLGLSVVCFVCYRGLLYFRQIGIDLSIEGVENLPEKIKLKKDKPLKELEEMVDSKIEDSIYLYTETHNIISNTLKLFLFGSVTYILGLIFVSVYIIIFLVNIL